MDISKGLSIAQKVMQKNSPIILTAMGIGGIVGSIACAIKATKKSDETIFEIENCWESGETHTLSINDKFKICWQNYIPMTCFSGLSIACFISANAINNRRQAALIAAYSLSENILKEYQSKVRETVGDKKEEIIRERIKDDRIISNPPTESNVIITPNGEMLCMEAISGRYFKSDINFIKKVENQFNNDLLEYMEMSLNDLYDLLDLEHTRMGEVIGCNINDGMGDGRMLVEFRYTSHLTPDDIPCLVIDYSRYPSADYKENY